MDKKNWFEINYHSRGTYRTNSQIKLKISMLTSIFCDYSDAYILVSGTITVSELAASRGNNGKGVVLEHYALFTDYISEINNTQIDNAKIMDVVCQCIL